MLPRFTPEPLTVVCNSCGTSAQTWDGQHPDLAVKCGCCPLDHDHAGLGCRPVTISAKAYLTVFDLADLLDALAGEVPAGVTEPDMPGRPVRLWRCSTARMPPTCSVPS